MHASRAGGRRRSVVPIALLAGALCAVLLTAPPSAARGHHDYTLSGPRWNPCATIRFKISGKRPYRGANADVRRAFHRIGKASGLHFRFTGRTRHKAWSRRDVPWDVTVTWTTPGRRPVLRGPVAGRGGWHAAKRGQGPWEIVSGYLVLDRHEHLRHGFPKRGRAAWGQVMMHEIGHVVGLGHARHRRELMYPVANSRNHRLSASDRAGLRRVGRPAGCIRPSLR